jgi:hypothetical protein
MADDEHGPWLDWETKFPKGELKDAIETEWGKVQRPHGKTHWAVQIHGTNPISGYRVRTPMVQAPDAAPAEED